MTIASNEGSVLSKYGSFIALLIAYMVISLTIVFFNYHLFTSTFKKPVFVSWVQQIVGFSLLVGFGEVGKLPAIESRGLNIFKPVSVSWQSLKPAVVPGFIFVSFISLYNICLQNVQVAAYQVARGTSLVFNVSLAYFLLGEVTSPRCLSAVMAVMVGSMIGFLDRAVLSLFAFVTGTLGAALQALSTVYTKKAVVHYDGDSNKLLMNTQFWAIWFFIPCIWLAGEWDAFGLLPLSLEREDFWLVWGSLAFSGVLAVALNAVCYVFIKRAGPVAFNILQVVKATLQSVGGLIIFGDTMTMNCIVALFLVVAGSYAFASFKHQEAEEAKRSQKDSSDLPAVTGGEMGGPKSRTVTEDDEDAKFTELQKLYEEGDGEGDEKKSRETEQANILGPSPRLATVKKTSGEMSSGPFGEGSSASSTKNAVVIGKGSGSDLHSTTDE
uniref:Sugar phosphate transporter domain-containing protein n=1 Tax=Chromera velia CCMP2878 TaxID=1169474 RepID=A0A0G4F3E3_9ALVE|eukprot:Cvel_14907.t1-p1 / transcript=Cvel_14907.t1 / gene=Cvel_14907 / organism=Chromera_velia_CCMP2878 / gene_product=GDP-fucose transporter 1, putative / transcript_product=GDP-fucose transporter 1, putative / location=Cvel_scaffold1080:23620-24936(+) / protein_length=439 / sequence_SO=supercontig / SO=protein_coding / is_pseudo=false